jgi:hypothetical protein
MSHPIEYAQQKSRRDIRKGLLIAVILLSTLFACILTIRTLARTAKWMWLRSQWETCDIVPNTVILDARPAHYTLKDDRIYPLKGFIPPARLTFPQLAFSPWVGTALLHAMRSPAGHSRIVCVDVTAFDIIESGKADRVIFLNLGVNESSRQSIQNLPASSFFIDIPTDADFRLFGATMDPKDSSHFQMKYQFGNRNGIIDGYLMDDDLVRIIPDGGTGGGPDPHNGWRPRRNP